MLNWISLLPTPPPLSFPPPRHVASYSPAACLLRLCSPSMKHRAVAEAAAGARCQSLPNHPHCALQEDLLTPSASCPTQRHTTIPGGTQALAPSQDTWTPSGPPVVEETSVRHLTDVLSIQSPHQATQNLKTASMRHSDLLFPVLCSSSLGYWTVLCLFQDESSQTDFSGLVSLWLTLSWSFMAMGVALSFSIRAT